MSIIECLNNFMFANQVEYTPQCSKLLLYAIAILTWKHSASTGLVAP